MEKDTLAVLKLIDARRAVLTQVEQMLGRIGDPLTASNILFGLRAMRTVLMNKNAHQYVLDPDMIPYMIEATMIEIAVMEGGGTLHRLN